MNKGLSPEERLLKLIKEGAEQPVSAPPASAQAAAPAETTAGMPQRTGSGKFFTFANINRLLMAMFFLVLLYAIFGLALPVFSRPASIDTNLNVKSSAQDKVSSVSQQPLEYYLEEIGNRNLFKSVILDDTKTAHQAQPDPTKVKIDELTKSLALKGIIAGNVPQAVIEDTKAGKTYFVIKQDKIGDASVDDIKDDRVKLRLDNQTFELVL